MLTGVVVITGVMASGKSSVAELLAQRLARAAHVRGDFFRRCIVSGRAEPSNPISHEAYEQLLLRYRLAMSTADTYVDAGFVAVVQDVIVGPILADAVTMLRSRPVRVIVLDPDPAVVSGRESERSKVGYRGGWEPSDLVDALRGGTPRLGLWLDTSSESVEQTVDTILARCDEALIDPESPAPIADS